mmetsp:Transcript_25689/g.64720  ORF Transcript_25689/g.64720 Transcript_25689/m.64720 type:complete len:223 (+) Transcript_25689:226-894(+)
MPGVHPHLVQLRDRFDPRLRLALPRQLRRPRRCHARRPHRGRLRLRPLPRLLWRRLWQRSERGQKECLVVFGSGDLGRQWLLLGVGRRAGDAKLLRRPGGRRVLSLLRLQDAQLALEVLHLPCRALVIHHLLLQLRAQVVDLVLLRPYDASERWCGGRVALAAAAQPRPPRAATWCERRRTERSCEGGQLQVRCRGAVRRCAASAAGLHWRAASAAREIQGR